MMRRRALKAIILSARFILLLVAVTALDSAVFAADIRRPAEPNGTLLTEIAFREGIVVPYQGAQSNLKRLTHLPGKLLVKLKTSVMPGSLSVMVAAGAVDLTPRTLSNRSYERFKEIYLVSAGEQEDLSALAAQLRANEAVDYVEPIGIAYSQLVPNDPLYSQQWSHQKTGAEAGWNITTGDPSVVIAVVDTGVAYDHPDLSGNIWRDTQGNPGKDLVNVDINDYLNAGFWLVPGEDYQGVDFDPSDFYGHGTHVAGIAAASGNNGIGVSGVCPSCRIMPVRAGFALRRGGGNLRPAANGPYRGRPHLRRGQRRPDHQHEFWRPPSQGPMPCVS